MMICRIPAWAVVFSITLSAGASAQPPVPGGALTLQAALAQARANAQQFAAAQTAAGLAAEDRKQAFGTLLPSLSGFTQYIYTQPNGTPSGVFVANDGPKIYNMWLTVHGDVFAPGH